MVRPLNAFPTELLINIAEYLEPERTRFSTPTDRDAASAFRLACRAFATAGVSVTAKRLTTLYVTPHPDSLRAFTAICEHPLFSRNIEEVVYVGDVIEHYRFLAEDEGRGLDLLSLSEVGGLIDDVPELQCTPQRQKYGDLALEDTSHYELFTQGLARLPKLARLSYCRSHLLENPRAALHKGFNQRGYGTANGRRLEIDCLLSGALDRDLLEDILGEAAGVKTNYFGVDDEDWDTLQQVLEATRSVNECGRRIELRLVDIPLWILADGGQVVNDLAADDKLRMTGLTFATLTSLDLSFTENDPDGDHYWISALQAAVELESLRIAWSNTKPDFGDGFLQLLVNATVHEGLDWLEAKQFVQFLLRHRETVQSLTLRNILLLKEDANGELHISFNGADAEDFIPWLEPLRACFAGLALKLVEVYTDLFGTLQGRSKSIHSLQRDIDKAAQKLEVVELEPGPDVSQEVLWSYNFADWLLEATERRSPRMEAVEASEEA